MPKTMTQNHTTARKARPQSRLAQAKAVVKGLTAGERERLLDYMRKESAKAGRARVVADLKQSRLDYANGNVVRGTPEEILRALSE